MLGVLAAVSFAGVGGVAYGYFAAGRADPSRVLERGAVWGIVGGWVGAVAGYYATGDAFALGLGLAGVPFAAVLLTLVFLGGAVAGDWLEHDAKA